MRKSSLSPISLKSVEMSRLKILFLPVSYPREECPVDGIFIREHAKAALLCNDIVVLFAYPDSFPQSPKFYRISEDMEDGIRTIRVKYGGVFSYFRKKLVIRGQSRGGSSYLGSKHTIILRELLRIPVVRIKSLLYYWSIFAAFHRLVRDSWRPNIIHAHGYSAGIPAIILGRLYNIPVVTTEHWSGFARGQLTTLKIVKARIAMNRAMVILPVSNNLRKHIEDCGVKNRYCVVPNAVDTKVFYPLLNGDKRENEIKNILIVALLTSIKGVTYLLEALNQIKGRRKDFILDIVGDGPNRTKYERTSADLGLNDMIRFHGLKPKEEVAEFMRQCDFFVLPSLIETFGVVLIEALASGKPVVATNVGGPREIINEKVGMLVPPKDVKALAEAIDYMLDHYKDYYSENIAQYARGRFSYEAVGQKLDEIYRKVIRELWKQKMKF